MGLFIHTIGLAHAKAKIGLAYLLKRFAFWQRQPRLSVLGNRGRGGPVSVGRPPGDEAQDDGLEHLVEARDSLSRLCSAAGERRQECRRAAVAGLRTDRESRNVESHGVLLSCGPDRPVVKEIAVFLPVVTTVAGPCCRNIFGKGNPITFVTGLLHTATDRFPLERRPVMGSPLPS